MERIPNTIMRGEVYHFNQRSSEDGVVRISLRTCCPDDARAMVAKIKKRIDREGKSRILMRAIAISEVNNFHKKGKEFSSDNIIIEDLKLELAKLRAMVDGYNNTSRIHRFFNRVPIWRL